MTTAVADIIRQAYFLANILDPIESVEGFMQQQGLLALNTVINQWSSLGIYIPTYKTVTVNILQNVYTYNVTPIITEFLQGHLEDSNNIRYLLTPIDLKRQNSLNYQLSVTGPCRPDYIYVENAQANIQINTTLWFYPVPDQNYTATIYVKQLLPEFTYSQSIDNLPLFYFKALTYQTAKDLSAIYASVLAPQFIDEYEKLMTELKAANVKDYSCTNENPLNTFRRFRPWGAYVG